MLNLKKYISTLLVTIFLISSFSNNGTVLFANPIDKPYENSITNPDSEEILIEEGYQDEEIIHSDDAVKIEESAGETMSGDYDHGYDRDKARIIIKYKTADSAIQKEVLSNVETEIKDASVFAGKSKLITKSDISLTEGKEFDVIDKIHDLNIEVITIENSDNINTAIELLEQDENVEYAQQDYTFKTLAIPTDPDLDLQWGLKNNGQTINGQAGTKDIDINISPVWEGGYEFGEVVVGVLDTGIDITHRDLSGRFVQGWDFVNRDDSVFDEGDTYHGTQISGIIAANQNNDGISGVAPNAKIMPLKFIQDGYGYTTDAIEAIEYAKKQGVKIINCSWGSDIFNFALKDVMENNSDILFVCAAGNSGNEQKIYPAAFDLLNVISVTAIDNAGNLWSSSNYGDSVDIAAPGADIYTTGLANTYGYVTGTSMSTAYVTGAAALYKGLRGNINSIEITQAIKNSVKPNEALNGKVATDGMLDVFFMLDTETDAELPLYEWEKNEMPQEVLDLLEQNPMYTSLNINQKEMLSKYVFVRKDTMEECAGLGLGIKESISKAIIMQRLNLSSSDMMKMIENQGSEQKAYSVAKDFINMQFEYIHLNGTDQTELIQLLVDGYKVSNTIYAYIASGVFNMSVKDIITNNESDFSDADFSSFSDEDQELLKETLAMFCIDAQQTINYLSSKNISVAEFRKQLFDYQDDINIFVDIRNEALEADGESTTTITSETKEYPAAPFNYRSGTTENINLNTGALIYEENIATIPGINGLDLELTMQYDSERAHYHSMVGITKQEKKEVWNDRTHQWETQYTTVYENVASGNGSVGWAGWDLKFDSISVDSENNNKPKQVRFSDGSVYAIREESSGSSYFIYLVNYPDSSVTIEKDYYSIYGVNSRYALSFADGKKEFFDAYGNILGIQDRYGNIISFSRSGRDVNIYDTRGKVTSVYYGLNDIVITLPDGAKTTYQLELHEFNNIPIRRIFQKTDAENRITKYTYSTDPSKFDFFKSDTSFNGSPKTIYYINLRSITYPTGLTTKYDYEPTLGHLGEKGIYQYYRVSSRSDYDGTTPYNTEKYSYSTNNFTGYPSIRNLRDSAAYNFTFTTTVTNMNEDKTIYTFDNFQRKKSEELISGGATKTKISYEYSASSTTPYPYPSAIKKTVNGKSNSYTTTECFSYDLYGNVTQYWSPLADGDTTNKEYLTEYSYYGKYGPIVNTYVLPYTKTYKKDAATKIEEKSQLTEDKKSIEMVSTTSGNNLIARKNYTYDIYGNVIEEMNYINSNDYITTMYAYLDNYAYLGTKKTAGITTGTFTYDSMGRVTSSTDANGNRTSYSYDKLGRQKSKTNPDITSTLNVYNDSLNTLTVYDEKSSPTIYTYDKFGNIKSIKDAAGATTSFTYDKLMRLISETDANGIKTEYTYDYLNRILTKAKSNYKETYVYDDAYTSEMSRVVKTVEGDINAPSIKTATYMDKYGRIIKQTCFEGESDYTVESYTYDYVGNKTGVTNARGYTTKYEYDFAGRVTKVTNPDISVFQTGYDWLGRKITSTDPKNAVSKYTYNSLSQLTKEEIPFEGSYYTTKIYEYDNNGNVTRQNISNNKPGEKDSYSRTDYEYNNRNWLTKVTTFDKNAVENYTGYKYDKVGNKIEMLTANGDQSTKYEYDNLNQMTKLTDALNQTETYLYDKNGNLINKTDRNGNVITNTYDVLNRLTEVSVTTPSGKAKEFIKYAYAKTGAKIKEENENLITTFKYDSSGRLISQTDNGIEKQYGYDRTNNRTSFKLIQDGSIKTNQTYTYDIMNRLTKTYDSGALSATYTYDLNGNRETLVYPNGLTTTYTYNKSNLVTSLTNKKGTDTLSSFTYTYNLDGNQASKIDSTGRKTFYIYDGLGRLINETESSKDEIISKTYTYDKANNRKTMVVSGTESYTTTYAYDSNNRLETETKVKNVSTETARYLYDNNGNQIRKMTYSVDNGTGSGEIGIYMIGLHRPAPRENYTVELYGYDVFNRLVNVKNDEGTSVYAYKADGLRLSKDVNGAKTTHVWDGSNIVLEFGVSNDRYVRGINLIKSDTNRFYLFNAHGDVVQLTDTNGTVNKNYLYDAFGVEKDKDENDVNPFRYCGEYYDKETGTIYLRARYYDPKNARFMSEDSVRGKFKDSLSLNLYTYSKNNPVRYIDPTGHFTQTIGGKQYAVNDRYAKMFATVFGFTDMGGHKNKGGGGSASGPGISRKDTIYGPLPYGGAVSHDGIFKPIWLAKSLKQNSLTVIGTYSDFLDALGFMESSDNYKAKTPSGTYLGRYQMGPSALQDAGFQDKNGYWTDLAKDYGVTSKETFLNSPEAQEIAIRSYHIKVWGYITNAGLNEYVGKDFLGINVTESGLLAAGHLVGVYGETGIIKMFETGTNSYDGNGTAATTYMGDFGGYTLEELLKK